MGLALITAVGFLIWRHRRQGTRSRRSFDTDAPLPPPGPHEPAAMAPVAAAKTAEGMVSVRAPARVVVWETRGVSAAAQQNMHEWERLAAAQMVTEQRSLLHTLPAAGPLWSQIKRGAARPRAARPGVTSSTPVM